MMSEQAAQRPAGGTAELGARGERLAEAFLVQSGYRIVLTNFRAPIGRDTRGAIVTGEIDIIALDGETLCFVEVKTRESGEFVPVLTAIDVRKQRQIVRAARAYRQIFGIEGIATRYDAVGVIMPASGRPDIELHKGFWDEAVFRKKTWSGGVAA
ncbi:MAG: YraN family protein [Pyrinomonadaceae bacterium]|nr:YraN family protein [Pyrinomonadaceae bacterium]